MERLKQMKETLMSSVQSQLGNLDNVDAKELGEAVDMIKDLSEAIYYCTITKEMEECKEEKKIMDKMENKLQSHSMPQQVHQHYYPIPEYDRPYYRDMDRDYGKMYYDGNGGSYRGNDTRGNGRDFRRSEYFMPIQDFPQYPREIRDVREGRSPMTRRSYMESKEMHKGKEVEMQELEKYMQELSTDITDMIKEASPEEKQMLQQKLTLLASKVK